MEEFNVSGNDLSVQITKAADDGSLVDFLADHLSITTGTGTDMTLNMDASEGELIRASGNLTLNIANFFTVEGGFAFEKSIQNITLSDDSTVDTDMLTVGGSNVDAFAGANGGTSDALGLDLDGVTFALALFADQQDVSELDFLLRLGGQCRFCRSRWH